MSTRIKDAVSRASEDFASCGFPKFGSNLESFANDNRDYLRGYIGYTDSSCRSIAIGAYANCMWARDGFNVLNVSHGLFDVLSLTDVAGAFSLSQRLPFAAAMVALPIGNGLRTTAGEEVRTIQVADLSYVGATGHWMLLAISSAGNGFSLVTGNLLADDSLIYAWRNGEVRVKKMVAALVMWWSARADSDAILVERPRRKKRDDETRAYPRHWILGKKVVVHRKVMEYARDYGEGKPLEHQHAVRGHFRQQVCGPRNTQRKTIWIEPFYRGPDSEQAWAHIYQGARQ